jgi:hypothetical protein
MKQLVIGFLSVLIIINSCKKTGTMASIQSKTGIIELPANGEIRIWKDLVHPCFSVTLSNNNVIQSCEVYRVKDNGSEKWVSPSLQAGKTLTITVPSNGHLFFKNFNGNILNIEYKIKK